jgi:iron complex outermembrane receptor protein
VEPGPHEREAEEALTVTVQGAPLPARPASTTVVTAREFRAFPRRTAEDALKLVPGLTLVQHGAEGKGQQFFLRGFDAMHGSDVEVTVAGIPINEWSNVHSQGYVDLGFVVPEAIQSVSVTKGPFSVDQGPFATAGSVDYALGISEGRRGLFAGYTIGTTNRHRGVVTYSPRAGDGRDFIALEATHDDGFGQHRRADRASVLVQSALLRSETNGTLSVLGSGYFGQFQLPGALKNRDVELGRLGFYDSYDLAARGQSSRVLLGLRHSLQRHFVSSETLLFGGYRRSSLLENYTGFLLDRENGDRRRQEQETFSWGLSTKAVVPLTELTDLEAGLGVRGDAFGQFQDHPGREEETLDRERDLRALQVNIHMLLGVRLKLSPRLDARLGVRFDDALLEAEERRRSETGGGNLAVVSPRAVVNYRPTRAVTLSLAGGQGFRPPEARAFTSYRPPATGLSSDIYTGGSPMMTQGHSVELGGRYQPVSNLGFSASAFATWLDRESVYDHVSGMNLELNGTRRLGGEVAFHAEPWPFLTLRGDLTLVDGRFSESGTKIPFAPLGTGGFRAIFSHESGLRAGARFLGLLPRPLPHGAEGAPLAQFDLTLGWSYRNMNLDLELENVFDLGVREGEYHYASRFYPGTDDSVLPELHFVAGPPRNLRATFSASF